MFALGALIPVAASAEPYDHPFERLDRPHFEHEIVGRVEWSQPYHLELENDRQVFLHDGTVINPRGITLRHGMRVRIVGHQTERGNFAADEIDVMRRPFENR
jgi:hypothetical protein